MKTKEELQAQLRAINAGNAEHWAKNPTAHVTAAVVPLVEAHKRALTAADEAHAQAAQRARAKGSAASAAARTTKNIERDRRIKAAVAVGIKPKNIAADEKLSPSQVRKILQKPLP